MFDFLRSIFPKNSKKPKLKSFHRYHLIERSARRQYFRLQKKKNAQNVAIDPQPSGNGWQVTWQELR